MRVVVAEECLQRAVVGGLLEVGEDGGGEGDVQEEAEGGGVVVVVAIAT